MASKTTGFDLSGVHRGKEKEEALSETCSYYCAVQDYFLLKLLKCHRLKKLISQRGNVGGGINQELGISIHRPLYIRQITNKDLLYSRGNVTQYSVITYMRKESEKE